MYHQNTVEYNQIVIHPNLYSQLKSDYVEIIKSLDQFWFTRIHEPNSKMNLFPGGARVCKSIEVALIRNKNVPMVDANLIKSIITVPFLCKINQIITLDLSESNIEQKFLYFNPMSKVAKNLLKYKRKDTLHSFYQDPCIFLEVINVQHIEENINDEYFIVDFQKTTQIKFSDYLKNVSKQYNPVLGPKALRNVTLNEQIYNLEGSKPLQNKVEEWINNSQQLSICVIESNKNLGKRTMFKRITQSYRMTYHETDLSTMSSISGVDNTFSKILYYAPCLVYVRNFDTLKRLISLKHNSDINIHLELYWIELRKRITKQVQELNIKTKILIIISVESLFDHEYMRSKSNDIFQFQYKYDKQIGDLLLNTYKMNFSESQIQQLQVLFSRVPWRQSEKVILQWQESKSFNFDELMKKIESLSRTEVLSNIKVRSEDVGGMEAVLEEIAKTISLPQQHPEIFDDLVRPRRGVLFFGPPGTGKTLMAKCIANECNMNFISVKGPEMLNMYIGESEKNIRDLFQRARDNCPCIIFFDELDALAPSRGNRSDSNQVMDRIVAQFLTEIDQLQNLVFVIGATNRPDLLDSSLLTPGRFDKLIYLGIKDDQESRIKILQAQTRKVKIDEDVDFVTLLEIIPRTFTGADFQGLVSAALLNASKRIINKIEQDYDQHEHPTYSEYLEKIKKNIPEVKIAQQDFIDALPLIKPSVTEQDLLKYKDLQLKYCK